MPRNKRRPFFNKFGWTQGIDYFCNCATNSYDSMQAKFNKRFSQGYSAKVNYTLQRVRQHGDTYFETDLPEHQGLYDSDLEYGPPDWDRVHNFVFSLVAEIPVGRGRTYMSDASPVVDAFIGGWQFNTNTIIQSGLPFNVTYKDAGADRDTGPNRPNLIGDAEGAGNSRSVVQQPRRSDPPAARSAARRVARSATCRATHCVDLATGGLTRRGSSTSALRRRAGSSSGSKW